MLEHAARSVCWDNEAGARTSYDILNMLSELCSIDGFNRAKFLEHSDFDGVRDNTSFRRNFEPLIFIDGRYISLDVGPYIVNGRTLVPIGPIAAVIGATASWDGETKTATITRAYKEIKLTIDNEYALVNDKRILLAEAPRLTGDRTFLPLGFVLEQFSQSAEWDGVNSVIYIEEDMSFARENSNIKEWILGCAAILAKSNNGDPYSIGMNTRSSSATLSARRALSGSWSCDNRVDLLETILIMTDNGHARDFDFDAMVVNSMSDAEYNTLLQHSSTLDRYMWQLVKDLSAKWGDKGINAWDWFRMAHLAGWGYLAGYLELEEVYVIVKPIAERLRSTFSSWDEATENYMDGYAYWSRTDVSQENTQYKQRLQIYENLKSEQEVNGLLFDPAVWTDPVIGVKDST